MYRIALKMLVEDRTKFIGMILAISFSAIIITQQMAIFLGIMQRSCSLIQDTPHAQIWVMNPSVKMVDDINPIRDIDLLRIRSIEGIKWAMPFFKGAIQARLPNGQFQNCNLYGVDSATFIGAPHTMIAGRVEDLRTPFSIILDKTGLEDKLMQRQGPGKPSIQLNLGDWIELNDNRAKVVGVCQVSRTFGSDPVIYTTYDRALYYSPRVRKQLSFIIAQVDGTMPAEELCKKIEEITQLRAYTSEQFRKITINYYLKYTGIPINFGLAVLLGLLIGAAITGQIFFNFTSDNLKYLALFSIVGASHGLLARLTLLQASWVAFLGWGIGSGVAAFVGFVTQKTQLAFYLPWQLFVGTGLLMWLICIAASLISIVRIFRLQLGIIIRQ